MQSVCSSTQTSAAWWTRPAYPLLEPSLFQSTGPECCWVSDRPVDDRPTRFQTCHDLLAMEWFLLYVLICLVGFGNRLPYIAQAGFELWSDPSASTAKFWDHRCVTPCSTQMPFYREENWRSQEGLISMNPSDWVQHPLYSLCSPHKSKQAFWNRCDSSFVQTHKRLR